MNKLKQLAVRTIQSGRNKAAAAGALAMVAATNAMAALPTAATDAITAVGADGASIQAAVWIPLGTVTGGFVLMKLFKRGANKV